MRDVHIGDYIQTTHGRGIVKGISATTLCVTSIDVELLDEEGRVRGWAVISPGDIEGIQVE